VGPRRPRPDPAGGQGLLRADRRDPRRDVAVRSAAARRVDALYVPHGIDTNILCPGDREQARGKIGVPGDAFVVGMVAANKGNPSRKSFDEAFQAFARLLASHKDAVLYLHTEASGVVQGVDLPRLLAACDIPPANVVFCDQYAYQCLPQSTERMADTYRAMDVLLNPAQGEGFGVPMIEAQACGTPVITTDFSACPEVGKVGWHIGGQPFWTQQMSWQVRPNVDQITDALRSAYDMAGRLRDQAREHALTYDSDRVTAEHWVPALAEIDRRLADREPRTLEAVAA
jgi:glycosyltransferase involved in cell wall biosynthesis